MSEQMWDGFVKNAKRFVDTGLMEELEVNYKIEAGKNLEAARDAALSGADGWADLVMRGIRSAGAMVHGVQQARFREWLGGSSDKALEGLQAIWTTEDLSAPERIRAFVERFPPDATDTRGIGTRTRLLSVLLMGLDAKQYPPFAIMAFNKVYVLTGYDKPTSGADEATQYGHALGFLDRFIEEASKRGLTLNNRLEAQSVVWRIQDNEIESIGPADGPKKKRSLVNFCFQSRSWKRLKRCCRTESKSSSRDHQGRGRLTWRGSWRDTLPARMVSSP